MIGQLPNSFLSFVDFLSRRQFSSRYVCIKNFQKVKKGVLGKQMLAIPHEMLTALRKMSAAMHMILAATHCQGPKGGGLMWPPGPPKPIHEKLEYLEIIFRNKK